MLYRKDFHNLKLELSLINGLITQFQIYLRFHPYYCSSLQYFIKSFYIITPGLKTIIFLS